MVFAREGYLKLASETKPFGKLMIFYFSCYVLLPFKINILYTFSMFCIVFSMKPRKKKRKFNILYLPQIPFTKTSSKEIVETMKNFWKRWKFAFHGFFHSPRFSTDFHGFFHSPRFSTDFHGFFFCLKCFLLLIYSSMFLSSSYKPFSLRSKSKTQVELAFFLFWKFK